MPHQPISRSPRNPSCSPSLSALRRFKPAQASCAKHPDQPDEDDGHKHRAAQKQRLSEFLSASRPRIGRACKPISTKARTFSTNTAVSQTE